MKLAVFSHGKLGHPSGTKITLLKSIAERHGYKTVALDYTNGLTVEERLEMLRNYIASHPSEMLVLVGSSMGGYISTVLANEHFVNGLFLMCPALYMPSEDYTVKTFLPQSKQVEIVHGWNDTVVPFTNSIRFAEQIKASISLVDDNHRLEQSHTLLADRFDAFLKQLNI